ncbi:MAG: DUF4974 domain-containing protein [Paramuribaculum sp.]|nr:DUF4974 domain-containing protein [Paramuribaculum sp.]
MTNQKKTEDDIQFVTRYYLDDTLLPERGWRIFRASHGISAFRRNIAAAAVGLIVLTASAAVYFISHDTTPTAQPTVSAPSTTVVLAETTQKIEFRDAKLKKVVAEIERIYDVRITGVPEQEIKVTISYEGTAADVVEALNELFDLNLIIESKTETPAKQ